MKIGMIFSILSLIINIGNIIVLVRLSHRNSVNQKELSRLMKMDIRE